MRRIRLTILFMFFCVLSFAQSIDIDSNQQYAAQFGVRNIPTVLVFKDGELVDRKVGVSSKNDYAEAIDKLI